MSVHMPAGLRLTASDRPGVAQPVPERDIPEQPWGRILVIAVLYGLTAVLLYDLLLSAAEVTR